LKNFLPVIIIGSLLIAGYFLFYVAEGGLKNTKQEQTSESQIIQSSQPNQDQDVNFTATFSITTNGTKRIFTDSKYHNRSEDVFLTADDPSIVHVKKSGVTWQNFFDTLPSPMKVTKECLYTGTGQTFCNTASQSLKFFLNGQLDQNALDKEIKEGDQFKVEFN